MTFRPAGWVIGGAALIVAASICVATRPGVENGLPLVQSGILLATGVVVTWYTWETQRLRVAAEAQAAQAAASLEAAQESTAIQRQVLAGTYRPVLTCTFADSRLHLRNIGTGPAFSVHGKFRGELHTLKVGNVDIVEVGSELSLRVFDPGNSANGGFADSALNPRLRAIVDLHYRDLAGTDHRTAVALPAHRNTCSSIVFEVQVGADPPIEIGDISDWLNGPT